LIDLTSGSFSHVFKVYRVTPPFMWMILFEFSIYTGHLMQRHVVRRKIARHQDDREGNVIRREPDFTLILAG